MYKTVLLFVLAISFIACGGQSATKSTEKESQQLKQEVTKLDSISLELDKSKNEIDEASENLKSLLNELN